MGRNEEDQDEDEDEEEEEDVAPFSCVQELIPNFQTLLAHRRIECVFAWLISVRLESRALHQ